MRIHYQFVLSERKAAIWVIVLLTVGFFIGRIQ
jgi:hypothetical protein